MINPLNLIFLKADLESIKTTDQPVQPLQHLSKKNVDGVQEWKENIFLRLKDRHKPSRNNNNSFVHLKNTYLSLRQTPLPLVRNYKESNRKHP